MRRTHAAAVSVVLAVAGVAGAFAATKTLELGKAAEEASAAPDDQIAESEQKLDEWETSLQEAAAAKPPKLPKLPKFDPVQMPKAVPITFPAVPAVTVPKPAAAPKAPGSSGGGKTPAAAGGSGAATAAGGGGSGSTGGSGGNTGSGGKAAKTPGTKTPEPIIQYVQEEEEGGTLTEADLTAFVTTLLTTPGPCP